MNTIPLALADVEQAFRNLEFAIRLMCYAERDHIDREKFDTDVTLVLEKENVGFSSDTFSSLDAIILAARANVGVAFGVSAIVLDAAFETAQITRKPESNLQGDLLRTLVFMVRSAFAHNPAMPCWEARGSYVRTLALQIEDGLINIDFSQLNGRPFEYEHIGGLANWYRIRRAAELLIHGT